MKLAFIGTYPPRECGIGTFTNNLFKSMKINNNIIGKKGSYIIALNDNELTYPYPEEVKFTIRQEHQKDYLKASKFIKLSNAEICILQHEFGIFGGQSGMYILPLLHRIDIPLIVTLHTVLKTPSYNEKAVLQEICKMANKVVVMSHKAIEFLVNIYDVPAGKIALIEHGVPDIYFNPEKSKKELKIENKKVILTFGFVGRNKGIETVIKALPKVVEKYPDLIYIVLGKTHPNVLRQSGEEYRIFLMRMVKNRNLEKHVIFLNNFVDEQDLFKYLYASNIYITPYLNEAQITSGTLSYAVGIGSAVISTPYWHASELLAGGRGRLFDFNDFEGLTSLLLELLDNPKLLNEMKSKASEYGRKITWPKTGNRYNNLAKKILKEGLHKVKKEELEIDLLILPEFSLAHINRLTDDTGIIQHAKFGIPNLKEGYCLDDNARALLMVLMTYKQTKNMRALELLPIYLSYIHYMQNTDGTFRNFLSFSRNFMDEVGSEDSFGRTIWALGYLLANAPNDAYYQTGKVIFFKAVPNFEKLKSIRSIANTMIGISYYLKSNPSDYSMTERLQKMADTLIEHYEMNKTDNWKWFESLLAYDNGILPLALLHAAEILNNDKVTQVAIESMNFITENTFKENYLSIIGNEKWYYKDKERSVFAQQPVD
ncbi:MAG TPA: glycosyltransferase family 4 protein, partial [Bacteroidales bacterium]|nr:glycosyltransferase family 4 protein [Bacteroidales bacterium]